MIRKDFSSAEKNKIIRVRWDLNYNSINIIIFKLQYYEQIGSVDDL